MVVFRIYETLTDMTINGHQQTRRGAQTITLRPLLFRRPSAYKGNYAGEAHERFRQTGSKLNVQITRTTQASLVRFLANPQFGPIS